ncbi:MAG TPA: porin family protein [Bacteroidales bacterium]|nr:porin family protein [Bacteroidales bacterium]
MKKLLTLSAILLLATATFAQFTLGPKVGMTMSKLTTNKAEFKEELKTGWQAGVFVRFGKKLYIQPELMFVTKGGKITHEDLNVKTTVSLNTVQIPALVGYTLLNLKVVNLRIMAGPAISFVVNEEIDIDASIPNPITDDNIKNSIWSMQLGGGVDILMFTLDVRYEWGLNNIFDPKGGESFDMRNNLWNISLGWKIL